METTPETNESGEAVRLDRWLWAARFYKTRPLATEAVDGGKVRIDGSHVKPGRRLRVGDEIEVRRGPSPEFVVVRALSTRRGPATEAAVLYEETEESIAEREAVAERRRTIDLGPLPEPTGKPAKRRRGRRDSIRYS